MKIIILAFWSLSAFVGGVVAEPSNESPLTALERSLVFSHSFLRTDDQGRGYLVVQGEPLSAGRIRQLSPWDLMELVQSLANVEVPLSRFGDGDKLTEAWRAKIIAFAALADTPAPQPPEDIFDPALVLWDPGYIQYKNEWGQWTIHLTNRDIVQSDLPTLSPLEVQQAVEVLTGRSYSIEFVLDHLEAFRAQLSIVPKEAS